jgi:hypothetical protein
MSYFGTEKKLLLSISAISAGVTTQTIGTTTADLNIFNSKSLTQIVSSIGYPTISVTSNIITLEAGWKYCINARLKVYDVSPSAGESVNFFIFDNIANAQISSTGTVNITTDSSASLAQENCIAYIDATESASQMKIRASKNSGSNVTINASGDVGNANFTSHILIKAWK